MSGFLRKQTVIAHKKGKFDFLDKKVSKLGIAQSDTQDWYWYNMKDK